MVLRVCIPEIPQTFKNFFRTFFFAESRDFSTWNCEVSRHESHNRELKQPRRRLQLERHKFAYVTMKNNSFARFARAFFVFSHFADVLVLSTMVNDLFCSCLDDVSI